MKRRDFVKTAGLGLAGLVAGAPVARAARKKRKPNVILMMADDFGYECLNCNGGAPYKTPALDGLASKGVRFTNCVAQPLCTPSRVKIMTGKYNFRNYITFGELDTEEKTFGHMMRDGGYKTCVVGKWQLGRDRKLIDHFGFDEYCLWWLEEKSQRYFDPALLIQNGKILKDYKGKYGPDIVSDFMLDFIERHKDEPFFCYYPMILTHSPFVPTPDSGRGKKSQNEYFVDMVEYTDKIVGKIASRLERLGLRDDTVILFIGDNGTGRSLMSKLDGRDYPGDKGSMSSESGPHVPFIANWPAGGVRGKEYDDPIDLTDFLPTIADLTGVQPLSGVRLDGTSFAPRLRGESYKPRGWAYISYYGKSRKEPKEMARDTRYTLRETGDLFDFIEDPFYQKPIAKGKGGPKAEAARAKLQKILDRMTTERGKEDARLIALGKYKPPTDIPKAAQDAVSDKKQNKGKKRTAR